MEICAEQGRIQEAIDKVHAAGGGRVVLDGHYVSGTLFLKSNVELHLASGSLLQGSASLKDYPDFSHALCDSFDGYIPEHSRKALIIAAGAENIAITGLGTIDSRGPLFYEDCRIPDGGCHWKKPPFPRPRMLQLSGCRKVRIADAQFRDSPGWSFWLAGCEDMVIRGITLTGDNRMMNNDGIHLDSCRKVRISDCFIDTGDDAVVIRSIRKNPVETFLSEDIAVSNCVLTSTCSCIRIGCPLDGDIRCCVLSNLTMKGRFGITMDNPEHYATFRPELQKSGVSLWTDRILFQNIVVDVESTPLKIQLAPALAVRRLGGVRFSQVLFKGGLSSILRGSPHSFAEDIVFENAEFDKIPVMENVRGIVFHHCTAGGKALRNETA